MALLDETVWNGGKRHDSGLGKFLERVLGLGGGRSRSQQRRPASWFPYSPLGRWTLEGLPEYREQMLRIL